ncbi:MAG: carbonic anhydrase [Solirubrobacteraceae bacterium]
MTDSNDPTRRAVLWTERPSEDLPSPPASAAEARERLDAGSAGFARIGEIATGRVEVAVGADAFGLPRTPGSGLPQEPFAAALACSDARVPVELVLGQATNDLFVVRVAGNVPGTECVGSLHYSMANMPSVKLVAVLGHSQCGAVTAAVDALLVPETYLEVVHDPPLRAIVDSLLAGVRMAALALEDAHGQNVRTAEGFRDALISVSVLANAAITATVLDRDLDRDVVFGVFDLEQRTVGIGTAAGWTPGLADAPADDATLRSLLAGAAAQCPLAA